MCGGGGAYAHGVPIPGRIRKWRLFENEGAVVAVEVKGVSVDVVAVEVGG